MSEINEQMKDDPIERARRAELDILRNARDLCDRLGKTLPDHSLNPYRVAYVAIKDAYDQRLRATD